MRYLHSLRQSPSLDGLFILPFISLDNHLVNVPFSKGTLFNEESLICKEPSNSEAAMFIGATNNWDSLMY